MLAPTATGRPVCDRHWDLWTPGKEGSALALFLVLVLVLALPPSALALSDVRAGGLKAQALIRPRPFALSPQATITVQGGGRMA